MAPIDILSSGLSSLVTRPLPILTSPDLPPEVQKMKLAFAICHIVTIATLLPLVIFIMTTGIKRSQVLLNLFIAMSVNSAMDLLMAFSPEHPSRSLCLMSSAGSMAGTALISMAVMVTVLMVWGILRRASGKKLWMEKPFEIMLLWLPWIVFLVVLFVNLAYLLINPESLYVSEMTCYSRDICATFSHILAGMGLFIALIFDAWSVAILIHQRYKAGKKTAAEREMEWSLRSTDSATTVNLPVVGRVVTYSTTMVGALISAIVLISSPNTHVPAVYQSACGVSCFIVFGTQSDIWKTLYRLITGSPLSSSSSSRAPNRRPKTPSLPSYRSDQKDYQKNSEVVVTTTPVTKEQLSIALSSQGYRHDSQLSREMLASHPSPLDLPSGLSLDLDRTVVDSSTSASRSISLEKYCPESSMGDLQSGSKKTSAMDFAEALAELELEEDDRSR